MVTYPRIQLSRIRDIGFTEWDPIGILSDGEPWKGHPAADEYDKYLLHVVGLLNRGSEQGEAVAYLENIASEHMGLAPPSTEAGRIAAQRTVEAIATYLQSLPDGRASFNE